ncbi:uncharacterized protein LOC129894878 [Solanum dulcamara]|uniref:uncharacterized protein LOC129894878 n=1 Tax=Solanum dulcamara TaxID=45834 RepID=UPI0024866CDF|nr:uncharacterized protein LOC129894878 [Solanum dulcamara]
MTPFEALYGRKCRSPIVWFEAGEVYLLGVDLVRDTHDMVKSIQTMLLVAQNHQNEYVDRNVRDMTFEVGEKVLLKVSPTKGVMVFGKIGKLSPRYISPFEILNYVGMMAYRLALPPSLSRVHPIFYVSMLKKYHGAGDFIIKWDSVLLDKDLWYEEEPVSIFDRDVRKLRTKEFNMVKVQWKHHSVEEATWETEKDMRDKYPQLIIEIGTTLSLL